MPKKPNTTITVATPVPRAETIPDVPNGTEPAIGRWYWVRPMVRSVEERDDGDIWTYTISPNDADRELNIVLHVGSNYVLVRGATDNSEERIHTDTFWERCEFEPNPEDHINRQVALHQAQMKELMGEVQNIMSRLSITTGPTLTTGSDVSALAVRTDQPMEEYKTALTLAQTKTLPDLFKQIESTSSEMGRWMKALVLPLKAQAEAMKPALKVIEQRIFSVELYAGLIETVVQVQDGKPAEMTDKVHLLQRRAYMDEECLARYETGGMEFKDIGAFDKWLARPDNLHRLLPFPRCILSFRVRRDSKERDWFGLADFIKMIEDQELDKRTFLYIRNGEQLFRLDTGIEFGEKLFPDVEQQMAGDKVWARMFGHGVQEMLTEAQYQGMIEENRAYLKENGGDASWRAPHRLSDYVRFSPESVHYDDIARHVQADMAKHNRMVLVLQGLLDRSPVLHPHPAWSLWAPGGFDQALTLIYDASKALVAGEKPDFEAYRARLNASLKDGSVTVGQHNYWGRVEAEKENDRMDRDYRHKRSEYRPTYYKPFGNPGPEEVTRVLHYNRKAKSCTYEWVRERVSNDSRVGEPIRCTITVPAGALLNIDAYKPGDFHQFFADPRTRMEYLKWAPLLLEAEEVKAGNRPLPDAKTIPRAKRVTTTHGRYKYQQLKKRKALLGKPVKLVREVITKGGKVYPRGSLWRVGDSLAKGGLDIVGIKPNGRQDQPYRSVSCMDPSDLEVIPGIPEDDDVVEEEGQASTHTLASLAQEFENGSAEDPEEPV